MALGYQKSIGNIAADVRFKMAVYEIMSSRPALASRIYLDKCAIKTIVDSGFRGPDFSP